MYIVLLISSKQQLYEQAQTLSVCILGHVRQKPEVEILVRVKLKEEERSGDQGCSPALASPAGSSGARLASQTCPFLYHLVIVCRPPLAWVRVQFS